MLEGECIWWGEKTILCKTRKYWNDQRKWLFKYLLNANVGSFCYNLFLFYLVKRILFKHIFGHDFSFYTKAKNKTKFIKYNNNIKHIIRNTNLPLAYIYCILEWRTFFWIAIFESEFPLFELRLECCVTTIGMNENWLQNLFIGFDISLLYKNMYQIFYWF